MKTRPLVTFLPTLLLAAAGLFVLATPSAQAQENSSSSSSQSSWFGGQNRIVGSGQVASEKRTIGEFDAVAVSGSMKLVVRQAGAPALEVRADDNLLAVIETTVDGRTLQVRFKRGTSISTRNPVIVTVDAAALKSIASSGSGDVELSAFKTPALALSISGSGDMRFKALDTDSLALSISGSGDVRGDGRASKLKVSIAGSGDVRLPDLQSEEVQISIAGSGDAVVNAARTLSATIAGSGDVRYTGAAAVSSRIAGSGSVKKL